MSHGTAMAKQQYEIIVAGTADAETTVLGIRALLKRLGRNYGLRCVTVRPRKKNAGGDASPPAKSLCPADHDQVPT